MKEDPQEILENDFNQDELISMMSVVYKLAASKAEDFHCLEIEKPHAWMQYIKDILRTLITQSPTWFHLNIAVKVLTKSDEKTEPDAKLIQLLAEKFIESCEELNKRMKYPETFSNLFNTEKLNPYRLEIVSINEEECDKEFLGDGIFIWDEMYLKVLERIGPHGKKVSKWLETDPEQLPRYFHKYAETKNAEYMKEFWFIKDDQNNETLCSRALLILCECVWFDIAKPIWEKRTNGSPALARPVIKNMIIITGPTKNKKFIEKDGSIIYCDQNGNPLLMAPAIDPNMINLFQRGAKGLSTLTGHKMLRWQVNTGFERWSKGESDPRLIEVDGGYSRIAELIKCNSTHDIAKIKEILHAQAHGQFIFSDGSYGNMITLRIEERYQNLEPSKIHIVLGDMLLPAYACQFQGSNRLLIPIGDLPPLHGSNNSHASQAQLQLLVFKEFSNQSDRLAQEGSVLITTDQWKQLAQEAGLSADKVNAVVNYWCQSDLFNCFLERQGDEFRLASYYDRAQKFLENQGRGRIINSKKGKKSAEKRVGKFKKK